MNKGDVNQLLKEALALKDKVVGLYHVVPDDSRAPQPTHVAVEEKKEEDENGEGEKKEEGVLEQKEGEEGVVAGSASAAAPATDVAAKDKTSEENAGSQVPRKLVVDFLENGVAYGEDEETEQRVSCSLALDVCETPVSCIFSAKERVIEGINVGREREAGEGCRACVRACVHTGFASQARTDPTRPPSAPPIPQNQPQFIGSFKVRFKDSIFDILVPGQRTYDPAGVVGDEHCSLSVGRHCAISLTAFFTTMVKAFSLGASVESVVKLHRKHFLPIIERYHGEDGGAGGDGERAKERQGKREIAPSLHPPIAQSK